MVPDSFSVPQEAPPLGPGCGPDRRSPTYASGGLELRWRSPRRPSPASTDVTAARADNVVVTLDARYQDSPVQSLVDYHAQCSAAVAGRPAGAITADIVKANGTNGESQLEDVIANAQLAATGKQNAVAAFMNAGGIRADPVNSGLDIDAFTAYLGAHPSLAPPDASRITMGS